MIKMYRFAILVFLLHLIPVAGLFSQSTISVIDFEGFLKMLDGEEDRLVIVHVMDVATANVGQMSLKGITSNKALTANENVKLKYVFLPYQRDKTLERAKLSMNRLSDKIQSPNAEFYILDAPERFDGYTPFKPALANEIHEDYDPQWTPFTVVIQSGEATLYQVQPHNRKANTLEELLDFLDTVK